MLGEHAPAGPLGSACRSRRSRRAALRQQLGEASPVLSGIRRSSLAHATSAGRSNSRSASAAASRSRRPWAAPSTYFRRSRRISRCWRHGAEPAVHDLARNRAPLSGPYVIGSRRRRSNRNGIRPRRCRRGRAPCTEAPARLPWGHVVERLARAQREARDALVVAAADEQLRAAPVIHHERDSLSSSASRNSPSSSAIPAHRQVGVGAHRVAVATQRQRRRYATAPSTQPVDHVAPQRAVHHQPVAHHHDRSLPPVSS